jgi:hypothetical protein
MTDLRQADALLVVPEPVDGRVFVRNRAGQLVAELRKMRGGRVELALDEGRYDVHVVKEQRVLGGSIELAAAGRVVLDEARLSIVALEPSALRGEPMPPLPPAPVPERSAGALTPSYLLALRAGPAVSTRPGTPIGFATEAAVASWFGGFVAIELSSGISRTSGDTKGRVPVVFTNQYDDVRDVVTSFPTRLTAELGLPTAPLRPYVLGGGGITFVRVERHTMTTYAPALRLRDDGIFFGFHAGIGASLRLGSRISGTIEARYSIGDAGVLQEQVSMRQVTVMAGVSWGF